MHKDGGITTKAFLLPILLLSFFGILLWPLQSSLPVLFHTEIFGNKSVILVRKQAKQPEPWQCALQQVLLCSAAR